MILVVLIGRKVFIEKKPKKNYFKFLHVRASLSPFKQRTQYAGHLRVCV